MDFSDTPAEAAFRCRVIEFLDAHADHLPSATDGEDARLARGREWQALKADNDFACITWPKEWGRPWGHPD